MGSQILANPYPYGRSDSQMFQELHGSVVLFGSAVAAGEPLDWSNVVSGIGYNEANFVGNGVNGPATALITGAASSSTVITFTAANNFPIGASVTVIGMTTTNGKKLNGLTFVVATASSSSFTAASTLNPGTSGADVGMAVSGNKFSVTGNCGPSLHGTVTALSASAGVITVTCANTFLPGAQVSFSGFGAGTLGTTLNGLTLIVATSTSTAFTMVSALTGSTDTGVCVALNPVQPFSVNFWSALGSGCIYQYSATTGVLYVMNTAGFTPAGTNTSATPPVFTGTAVAAAPLLKLAAAAYPAGVLADVIKYTAYFPKV